ncbi:ATP-binding protein [Ideonella sp.]|uniref:ATP-binding protein n=1 Tax=Ideonella sp. TaxID=1929293 RepID=UPI0035ADD39D
MEVSRPRCPHRVIAVQEATQVGQARRAAMQLAHELGFDETAAGRVGLAATELGTNLVKHARGGRLMLAAVDGAGADDGEALVELISVDDGPGIADLPRALADGFSTAGTLGGGLGAVRRLARCFDAYSRPGAGSVFLARLGARSGPAGAAGDAAAHRQMGAVMVCAPGESVCGDGWAVGWADDDVSVLVADGLGHGPGAAQAAEAAVDAFARGPAGAADALVERLHAALGGTRGAAVAVARVPGPGGALAYAGAGNICGRLFHGLRDQSLPSQPGTAGFALRRVRGAVYDCVRPALLVMHSDGVTTRWSLPEDRGLLARHPSLLAAWLCARHARGNDDATVVAVRLAGDPAEAAS